MPEPMKLLVDSNVWVDYYVGSSPRHNEASECLRACVVQGAMLYTSVVTVKDVFQLIVRRTKKELCSEGIEIDGRRSAAILELGWSCVRDMRELSIIVPVGDREVLYAEAWRDDHGNFEDDLILAAAKRADADYVVTSDVQLLKHAPRICITLERAGVLLSTFGMQKN